MSVAKAAENKTPRRLKRASETVRQRAEKGQQVRPKRLPRLLAPLVRPFRLLGRLKRLKIWRPFKFAGRILGKLLVPPYIRSSFRELRLVTWPNRSQTLRLTSAVLIFALVFATIVAIVDFGLDKLFKQVILR